MNNSFSAESYQLSLEEMAEMRSNGTKPSPRLKSVKQPIKFYKFPKAVVDGICKAKYPPAMLLVAAILETYFDDYEKRNPVRLTSRKVKEYGLSPWQKYQALKVLDGIDQFMVERTARQNPLIFLKWELTKD